MNRSLSLATVFALLLTALPATPCTIEGENAGHVVAISARMK